MNENLTEEVSALLEKCFDRNFQNFEVTVHPNNKKGDGFMGDMLFLSLKIKQSNKQYHVVIKQVLRSEVETTVDLMSSVFSSEICFYANILPAFQTFQKKYLQVKPFDNVPKCFGTSSVRGKEKVVLENLKIENYELHPKSAFVTSTMYEEIFKVYGKFHAISFAFKELDNKTFLKAISTLKNNWALIIFSDIISNTIKKNAKRAIYVLANRGEFEITRKLQEYVDNKDIYKELMQYTDQYGVILHGDCWSNNMMFKYDASRKLKDIKLVDFQETNLGSPVCDLIFTFYSGANKDTLNNLETFLKIYHTSLDENLKLYGLNADNLYPYDILKKEWKNFCPFGFMVGCLMWGVKYLSDDKLPDLNKVLDNKDQVIRDNINPNGNKFDEAMYNLVKHLFENNFL